MLNAKVLKHINSTFSPKILLIALFFSMVKQFFVFNNIGLKYAFGGDTGIPLAPSMIIKFMVLNSAWTNLGVLYSPNIIPLLLYAFAEHTVPGASNSLEAYRIGLYIIDFIVTLIALLSLYYAMKPLLDSLNNKTAFVSYIFACVFFLFNPWLGIDTFKSYFSLTTWASIPYLILMGFILRFLKTSILGGSKAELHPSDFLFLAFATALLPMGFSSVIRFIIFFFVLLILAAMYSIVLTRTKLKSLLNLRFMMLAIIIIIVVNLSSLLMIFYGYQEVLKSRVQIMWKGTTPWSSLAPSYATIINAFRLMNYWVINTRYMPYHDEYFHGMVAFSSMLWPLTALGLSLFTIMREELAKEIKKLMLFMLLLTIIGIFWGTGGNPPLGSLYSILVSNVPYLNVLLPHPIFNNIIRPIYIVLVSINLALIIENVMGIRLIGTYRPKNTIVAFLKITSIVTLCLLLIASSEPIISGKVFSQYFDERIKGFLIPDEYLVIKRLELKPYEHILLLPATRTYERTSWGWQGTMGWYRSINPQLIVLPQAPYLENLQEWRKIYYSLSMPKLKPISIQYLTSDINLEGLRVFGANVVSKNMSREYITVTIKTSHKGKHINIAIPTTRVLNLTKYKYLFVMVDIRAHLSICGDCLSMWFGVASGKYVGWYLFRWFKENINNNEHLYEAVVPVGLPDKPWPLSVYNPEQVTGFIIRLFMKESLNNVLHITISIGLADDVTFYQDWFELLELINIRYIIVDKSLLTPYRDYTLNYLINVLSKTFKLEFNGKYIVIFETNISSSKYHTIPNSGFKTILPLVYAPWIKYILYYNNTCVIEEYKGLVAVKNGGNSKCDISLNLIGVLPFILTLLSRMLLLICMIMFAVVRMLKTYLM